MTSAFVLVATLLAVATAALVAWPLLRPASGATAVAPDWLAAGVAALLLLGGGAALYSTWSNWNWPAESAAGAGAAATPAAMVSQLASRLEKQPEDLNGWLMLGRSYAALEQFPLAERAYQRADRLAGGRNVEALTGWAEALALENEDELTGRAAPLLEKALELDPASQKALFYGAVSAQRRGDAATAIARYSRLLDLGPPDAVRGMLEAQIAALRGAPTGGAPGADAAPPASAQASRPAAGNGSAAIIRVRIVSAPGIAAAVRPAAPLFVFVRKPGQAGPPLAVKRLEATLPQVVELSSADAMVAERSFAAGDQVDVVARVSLTGQPTATSGDPFGQVRYDVGRGAEKELVIDRLTP
jgi:cytochrome c-type biogenesis protein CcmH